MTKKEKENLSKSEETLNGQDKSKQIKELTERKERRKRRKEKRKQCRRKKTIR